MRLIRDWHFGLRQQAQAKAEAGGEEAKNHVPFQRHRDSGSSAEGNDEHWEVWFPVDLNLSDFDCYAVARAANVETVESLLRFFDRAATADRLNQPQLEREAVLEKLGSSSESLRFAVEFGCVELVKHFQDIWRPWAGDEWVLVHAVIHSNRRMLDTLVRVFGAENLKDVGYRTSDGRTMLMWACGWGGPSVVRALFEHFGVDALNVNAVDNDGNSALHWAVLKRRKGNLWTGKVLRELVAGVNGGGGASASHSMKLNATLKNEKGQTPLMAAIDCGQASVVFELRKCFAHGGLDDDNAAAAATAAAAEEEEEEIESCTADEQLALGNEELGVGDSELGWTDEYSTKMQELTALGRKEFSQIWNSSFGFVFFLFLFVLCQFETVFESFFCFLLVVRATAFFFSNENNKQNCRFILVIGSNNPGPL
jgi:hypothetical protein